MNFLLQADRDAYQSSIAISQALNLAANKGSTSKDMEKYIAAIDENYGQIGQRFDKFMKLHIDNGGKRFLNSSSSLTIIILLVSIQIL